MERSSYEPGTPSYVDIGTPDPDAAAKFYSSLFGWDVSEPDAQGNYRTATLRGKVVAGIGEQQNKDMPPYWTTYITVSDADTIAKSVAAEGGQVVVEPTDVMTAGRLAVCQDNVGAVFTVWQPRDMVGSELSQEPGALCWNELTTRKPQDAKQFYSAVFDWSGQDMPMGDVTYTMWMLAGQQIGGLMPMPSSVPAQVPSYWMTYFGAKDIDASTKKAESLGARIDVPVKEIPSGKFSCCTDPQGAMFGLYWAEGY